MLAKFGQELYLNKIVLKINKLLKKEISTLDCVQKTMMRTFKVIIKDKFRYKIL